MPTYHFKMKPKKNKTMTGISYTALNAKDKAEALVKFHKTWPEKTILEISTEDLHRKAMNVPKKRKVRETSYGVEGQRR